LIGADTWDNYQEFRLDGEVEKVGLIEAFIDRRYPTDDGYT